jgi:hypothetical protein
MVRVRLACCLLALAAGPLLAQGAHVTPIPEGVLPATPGGGGGVPCDVLIRYDDGSDDQIGSGLTLGGPPGFSQRLGIVAQAPAGGSWQVQSVGFFSEFWVTAGNVNIEVTSVSTPALTTSQPLFVDAAGDHEAALTDPICIPGGEEFSVMLCPDDGTWGVTGEDTSAPDSRSFFSQASCTPETPIDEPPVDLMIWACVTACPGQNQLLEVPTLGTKGLVVLGLLMAAVGAFWVFARRNA